MAFDIEETIQSQYATSPKIISLIKSFDRLINPKSDIELLYTKLIDLDTAEGHSLYIWGRLVGIKRDMSLVTNIGIPYWGFKRKSNKNAKGFDQAPFYSGAQGAHFELSDDAYRLLIKTKAMANISTGSLAELNMMLSKLLPNTKVKIFRIAPMHLRLMITGKLTDYELNLLSRGDLPPVPMGVSLEIIVNDAPFFGFQGGNYTPFNNGPMFQRLANDK